VPEAIVLRSDSPETTRALAARLGALLRPGDVVALSGDLGAGKTCFVQGLAAGMGIQGNVTSPTFILMRHHPGQVMLCHADAYRLGSAEEFADLGLDDVLRQGVLAVEWAEQVANALPADRVEVLLEANGEDSRRLWFRGGGPRSRELVEGLLAGRAAEVRA
jgi:tRNA threonylcarbamoyladenosine biosynthesis protein TsaE